MKKGFSYLKKRKNGIIAYLIMIIFMATSVLPAYADDEWSDEEKQEDAWMTYLMTNWPIDELHVSVDGAGIVSSTEYFETFDKKYTLLIKEMLDDCVGTDIENQCMHSLDSYVEIMKFLCGYSSRLVCYRNSIELYDFLDEGSDLFKLDPNATLQDDGKITCSLFDDDVSHQFNDIAYIDLLIDKDFKIPDDLGDRDAQKFSLNRLFKELIKNERDGQSIIGDIYNSDATLAGMLIRIYCPMYDYPYYDACWFQDHIAKMCYDYPEEIKSGKMYPWLKTLGFVRRGEEDGYVVYNSQIGYNYGDTDGDGLVNEYFFMTNEDILPGEYWDVGTSRDCDDWDNVFIGSSSADPSYFAVVQDAYTGVTISYDYDNYQYWGTDAVDESGGESD